MIIKGKTKSIQVNNNTALCTFNDDITAFNGEKHEILKDKGMINNKMNAIIMSGMNGCGIKNHFIRIVDDNISEFHLLDMIKIEFVVRNYAAGSACRNFGFKKMEKFDNPFVDLYMKNDSDPMISYHMACNIIPQYELDEIIQCVYRINDYLTGFFYSIGFIFVDGKFEFGLSKIDGEILLGDEISLDSVRIVDSENNFMDKELFRKGLSLDKVSDAYHNVFNRIKNIKV